MTVRWERFAGSTDSFAIRLAFMPDPDKGAGADPSDAASWGAIQFWVNGQNLCTHIDQGEVLQNAHWYLLPLLEWLAENWNPLLHEEKLPNRNIAETAAEALELTRNAPPLAGEAETVSWEEERFEWRARHAIRSARSGGLLPNIVIRRLRDLIEISWNDEPLAGTPDGFRYSCTNGAALLPPERVAQPLYDVLVASADYLSKEAPNSARISRLRSVLEELKAPAEEDKRLEWLAGLRETMPLTGRLHGAIPEQEMHSRWSQIVASLKDLDDAAATDEAFSTISDPLVIAGSCHVALMFSSMSPTVTDNDVRTIGAALVSQYIPQPAAHQLKSLSRPIPLDLGTLPWEQGYDLAELIHAELDLDLTPGWVDVADLMNRLGVTVLDRRLDDPKIRACGIVGTHHRPTVIQNTNSSFYDSSNARRFSLAHELCHLLFDQSSAQKLAIASGPWAPRGLEQRANAFAAMFLMPPDLVERAIADAPDPIHDLAGASAIARKLRVSRRSLIEHLYNLTLMSESERDELLQLGQD
ncbi:ImmA/IrrE family metallo-endopeptidase [Micromonospora aurantiaca]|uniref:ImmA/IrrE family metallo-endopeptidase n=1 Tax=Micromonospora aurantiaca (nom. illeg.) TaxID=47850 RepID=A0ABQ6U620_9ACTN|nr:ImmA/IrrE family metallo-endopeptidase [Micromonospora aurantiaca]KAB1095191.1 ImmA/IrrE family metallo-endopeptidase [Micromonospora aurantiaca]